jgi:hypothetical protein
LGQLDPLRLDSPADLWIALFELRSLISFDSLIDQADLKDCTTNLALVQTMKIAICHGEKELNERHSGSPLS